MDDIVVHICDKCYVLGLYRPKGIKTVKCKLDTEGIFYCHSNIHALCGGKLGWIGNSCSDILSPSLFIETVRCFQKYFRR